MGTDIIRKHNFQNAINRVKDYSLKKKKDIEIKSVKTIDEGIFFDTDHEVTGYELNDVIKVIQGHLVDINKRNNETVNEFYEIYQAFNYLDTEYVKGILTTVKGLEKTNNDVRIQQEELKKHHKKLANQNNKLEAHQGEIEGIIKNINKTIDILKVFKKEIDCLKHLSDIDRLWFNHEQLQDKVDNLSNDLSSEIKDSQTYKESSMECIKSIENKLNSELQLNRANSGIAFTMPLSGANNLILRILARNTGKELLNIAGKEENSMSETKYTLVAAIVNRGFSEEVMEVVRAQGVKGLSLIHI